MHSGHRISVIVPVYNSEKTITMLFDRLHEVLPGLAAEYELLLVNDGSSDSSWQQSGSTRSPPTAAINAAVHSSFADSPDSQVLDT